MHCFNHRNAPQCLTAKGGKAMHSKTSQQSCSCVVFWGFIGRCSLFAFPRQTTNSEAFSPPVGGQRSVFPISQRTAKRFLHQSAASEAMLPNPLRAQRAQPSAERAQRCDKPFLPVGCLCHEPHHEPGTPPPLRKERSKRQHASYFPTAPKAGAGCNPAAGESRGRRRCRPLGRG